MEKYNYDREGWKELDGMLWVQLKKFARVTLCTIAMVLVWIAAQPYRVFTWARHQWFLMHKEEIMLELEENERFDNLMANGHI